MKDYDMSFIYIPGKANVVEDGLSQIYMGSLAHVDDSKKKVVKDMHRLARLGFKLELSPKRGFMVHHNSESSLVVMLKSMQHLDTL